MKFSLYGTQLLPHSARLTTFDLFMVVSSTQIAESLPASAHKDSLYFADCIRLPQLRQRDSFTRVHDELPRVIDPQRTSKDGSHDRERELFAYTPPAQAYAPAAARTSAARRPRSREPSHPFRRKTRSMWTASGLGLMPSLQVCQTPQKS